MRTKGNDESDDADSFYINKAYVNIDIYKFEIDVDKFVGIY